MIMFRIAQINTLPIIVFIGPPSVYKKTNHTILTNYRAKSRDFLPLFPIIFGPL